MTVIRQTWLLVCVVGVLFALVGCQDDVIPNTEVVDNEENREIIATMEDYRRAVETLDVPALLALASPVYLDDNGTPQGTDDMNYEALRSHLLKWKQQLIEVRYQIRYRNIRFERDVALVDYTYTGRFHIRTPNAEGSDDGGSRWVRRLQDNRVRLRREGPEKKYRILSGM